eukprot:SAG31_NODE_4853_length_2904_cov_1.876649_1_plen_36_part_00
MQRHLARHLNIELIKYLQVGWLCNNELYLHVPVVY